MSYMPIEVTLGKEGGTKTFSSFKEVLEWVQIESQNWQWLLAPPDLTFDVRQLCNPVMAPFRNAFQQIQQEASSATQFTPRANVDADAAFASFATKIKDAFAEHYDRKGVLFSGTERAKFLTSLKDEHGYIVAAAACGFFIKILLPTTSVWVLKGLLEASYREHGFVDQRADHAKALEELRKQWSQDIDSSRAATKEAEAKLSSLATEGQALLKTQKENCAFRFDEVNAELKAMIAEAKRNFENLKNALDADMRLQAPVKYWTKKARSHFWLSWGFAAIAVIAGGGFWLLLQPHVEKLLDVSKGTGEPDRWHWQLGIVIAGGFVAIWFVRILVRLFLSNVHLHSDAKERLTMVQTYLALLSGGNAPKDEDRKLMLQTLFRPASTGLIKDDAVPLTIVELATKLGRQ